MSDRKYTSAGQELLKRIKIKEIELLKLKNKHKQIKKLIVGTRKRMKVD